MKGTGRSVIALVLLLPMTLRTTTTPVNAQDTADKAAMSAEALFAHRVLPIFKEKCFGCHGEDVDDVRGRFNMLTRQGLLKGGESEQPAIVPGEPEESPLYLAVKWESYEMPPKENDRLSAEQIEYVEQWIVAGAPWPDEKRLAALLRATGDSWNAAGGVTVRTSGGLSEEWTNRLYAPENLWAYQPLWKDESGRLNDEQRNPVDVLVEEVVGELGLQLAPPADRRTLIRRATFDLIGLPPTPQEVDAFIHDTAPDAEALAKVVERLLASPHYGEQWARHWLDVVRYADSSGYSNDYERGNAWRYRDYVVRAFNEDKPYHEFIREQIAGDEIDASNPELLVAAGFLRMGPWELTGMEVPKIARQRFLDDVTDAVGQVFLGHMLQCAKCHDHKFDPVPTRDYYSIQAAFATTQLAERKADFLPGENTAGFEERKYLQQRLQFYQQTLRQLAAKQTVEAARAWYVEQGLDAAAFEQVVAELETMQQAGEKIDVAEVRKLLATRNVDPGLVPPRHVGFDPRDYGLERIARKGIERLKWRLERYEPFAFSVYSGRTPQLSSVYAPLRLPQDPLQVGELEETCILIGGDPFSPGGKVAPGVLSAVALMKDAASNNHAGGTPEEYAPPSSNLPSSVTGRRLALANWIASAENPLTARVMVNRIWQGHFGHAIAGNPNNFGTTGKKPSHSELLDYLAARFMQEGWSIKAMHRLIMSSETYRRASQHPDPKTLAEKDPDGQTYAVFRTRRLDAEELRDAMLWISGELNPLVGGIPVRPEMNLEAALQPRQVMGTFAEAWQASPLPGQRHRRSVYALRIRGQLDPFLEVFNAPSPDLSCESREASTVTPQVFAMFNSQITFDRALALANRVLMEPAEHAVRGSPAASAARWSRAVRGSPDPAQSPDRRSPERRYAVQGDLRSETPARSGDLRRARESLTAREAVIDRLFQLAFNRSAEPKEIEACLTQWDRMTVRHETLRFDAPEYPRQVLREAVEENTGEKFTFVEPLEFYADLVPDLKPSEASPELRGLAEVCLVLLNSNEFAYVY